MNLSAPFPLPPLPYEESTLEPQLDRRVIHLHYHKHMKGYVDRLNQLLEPYDCDMGLVQLITQCQRLSPAIREDVHNNAGGVFNHAFYFEGMTPDIDRRFSSHMYEALANQFGSLENFRAILGNTTIKRFGSGWAWLACDQKGALQVCSTPNQNTVMEVDLFPLLCVDCWEHAYYLQYENRRAEYFENWFQLIDWVTVEQRYLAALRECHNPSHSVRDKSAKEFDRRR